MRTRLLVLLVVLALVTVGAAVATSGAAHANGGPALVRQVFSGGATASSATGVSLRATLGQPFVGVVAEGDVSVGQGFWHGGVLGGEYRVYLPLVVR